MKFVTVENVVIKEINFHFLDIVLTTDFPQNQVVKNTESHKHSDWEWIDVETFEKHY